MKKVIGILLTFVMTLTLSSVAANASTIEEATTSGSAETGSSTWNCSQMDADKFKKYEEYLRTRNEMEEMEVGDSFIAYQDDDTTVFFILIESTEE